MYGIGGMKVDVLPLELLVVVPHSVYPCETSIQLSLLAAATRTAALHDYSETS